MTYPLLVFGMNYDEQRFIFCINQAKTIKIVNLWLANHVHTFQLDQTGESTFLIYTVVRRILSPYLISFERQNGVSFLSYLLVDEML